MKITQVQQEITDRVIASLKTGKTFKQAFAALKFGMPRSISTGKKYTGSNVITLIMTGYESAEWGTYNAWMEKGGQVRKGEKATKIVFYAPIFDKDNKDEIVGMSCKTFSVFNREQVEIQIDTKTNDDYIDMSGTDLMSYFCAENSPKLEIGSPSYAPRTDVVRYPNTWKNAELANGTIAHEIIHSTGHKSRLSRDGVTNYDGFGSHNYSFEELIAELGSLFLCAEMGLLTDSLQDNGTAYIENWLTVLSSNPDWIYKAAQQASKASDFALAMIQQGEMIQQAQIAK